MMNEQATTLVNDKLLEDVYMFLKRIRANATPQDCYRWTLLWTVMNTDGSALFQMEKAVVKIDLENRRANMGRSVVE